MDYFDEQAYLTQSGQLYIEATAMALGKVYSFGPTFRAEKSKTRRHLTEFWMVEPEVAYATLDDLMILAEEFITFIVKRCLERRRPELETIGRDISKLEKIDTPFPRITYDEAVKMLQEAHAKGLVENRFEYGGDFGSPDETYISSQFERPVMVHRYPAAVKAFYMEPDPQRSDLALCVDVLAPEGYGEIIGGSQRTASYELLVRAHSRARPAARGVQVVSRSAQVWQRAALGIRDGHRARSGVDLRTGTCARDHSLCAYPAPAVPVATAASQCETSGRPFMATSPITKPLQNVETKHIRIIGVPLDLGQSRRGVDMGPSAMRVAGLEAKLEALGYDVKDGGNVPVALRKPSPKAILTQSI